MRQVLLLDRVSLRTSAFPPQVRNLRVTTAFRTVTRRALIAGVHALRVLPVTTASRTVTRRALIAADLARLVPRVMMAS